MEDAVLTSEYSMPMTLYFAICEYSCPKIVFGSLPQRPPDGIFTAFIILSFIGFIFAAMTIGTCFKLSCYSLQNFVMAKIKAAVRHTDRTIDYGTSNSHTIKVDGNLWHDDFCSFISSIVLVLI
jgi:hypothetical protein